MVANASPVDVEPLSSSMLQGNFGRVVKAVALGAILFGGVGSIPTGCSLLSAVMVQAHNLTNHSPQWPSGKATAL
jgi:hypothetical protein